MRTASRFVALFWVALVGALLVGGCGDERPKHLPDPTVHESGGRRGTGTGGAGGDSNDAGDASDGTSIGGSGKGGSVGAGGSVGTGGSVGAGGNGGAGGASSGGGDALDASDANPIANCGSLVCRGHGHCVISSNVAGCVCDPGYKLNGNGTECIVDESCIRLKHLQVDNCRYSLGPPAVAMFFAVDYCAGTAVLPEKLGDPATAFKILEDKTLDVKTQSESYATVIPRRVESYVTFVLDVSKSMVQDHGLLSEVVGELRAMIQQLKPAAGGPPVGVSIVVFGRTAAEYLPFTTNMGSVDASLAAIEANPAALASLIDPNGTSLIEATERGIHSVERIQALRDAVTEGGVLTTGAVVVVSDGNDLSGYPMPADLIKNTLVNVISIGIADEVDDKVLTAIGRDGSFLAPSAADRTQAFSEIAQRVKEYPKRSYLLGYCSQTVAGVHSVTITLANGVKPKEEAVCSFNATRFGSESCNADFFSKGCDNRECGGLAACGSCPNNGDCCSDGQCLVPAIAPDCRNQDELCAKAHQVCVPIQGRNPPVYECVDPVGIGAACDDQKTKCAPGAALCLSPLGGGQRVCTATGLPEKLQCTDPTNSSLHPAGACASLNCAQEKDGATASPYICLPQARVFDRCAGPTASAVCEPGASCDANRCKARQVVGCSKDADCVTGRCNVDVCMSSGACYFSWSEKMRSQ